MYFSMVSHAGKSNLKNTSCSDYETIPTFYGRSVHVIGILREEVVNSHNIR